MQMRQTDAYKTVTKIAWHNRKLAVLGLVIGVWGMSGASAEDKRPVSQPVQPSADAAKPETKGVFISLDDCVEIALQRNLNLKLSRLSDKSSDLAVRAQWARFYPVFSAGTQLSNTQSRYTNQNPKLGFTGGVSQASPWGTVFDFSMSQTQNSDPNTGSGSVGFDVRHPLWRGAGYDSNLDGLRSARIFRLISRGNLELQVQQLIYQVRASYASVVLQIQNREVGRQAVRSAQTFLNQTTEINKNGLNTKLDVSNSEVQLRGRELDLLVTERELESSYDQLKRLLDVDLEEIVRVDAPIIDFGDKSLDRGVRERAEADKKGENETIELVTNEAEGTVKLVTTRNGQKVGEPVLLFKSKRFDEKQTLEDALVNRLELLNSHRQLAISKLKAAVAKDAMGYQVDLTAGVRHNTNGNTFLETGQRNTDSWNVGVDTNIPWGKIKDRAGYENALLDLQKAEIELKIARTEVHADVRDIMRVLREREKSMLTEAQRVEQAKNVVRAEQFSFDRGLKDSFDLIRAQDNLLSAKTQFISRKLDYDVQIARLELVVGKPTQRVDLSGLSQGGIIKSDFNEELKKRGLPAIAPDATPRPESDPFNRSREYRKDPKPEPEERLRVIDSKN